MQMQGTGVSPGVGMGSIFLYAPRTVCLETVERCAADSAQQLEAYLDARQRAAAQLSALRDSLQGREAQAKIFEAHLELLEDEEMEGEIRDRIEDGTHAAWAVQEVFSFYSDLLAQTEDELIRQRAADLQDVKDRLLRILLQVEQPDLSHFSEPVILAARELSPSDTASLDTAHVAGIATEQGGTTSHMAVLARSLGIPAVLGIHGLTEAVRHGEPAVLDAGASLLLTGALEELRPDYERRRAAFEVKARQTALFAQRPGSTADGVAVAIGANLGSDRAEDLTASLNAEFVGLFRSEFLYMQSDHLPTEEEQLAAYRRVLTAFAPRPVTVRTLDIGGDKELPYLPMDREENPFLGLRALRLCLARPDLFRTQLRALLRASCYGSLNIMFPMVSGLEEFRRARAMLEEVRAELLREGCAVGDVGVGVMIETPSLALLADHVAAEADFASLGTNDLCQYLTAADRGNPAVTQYYQSFHPALFRLVGQVARSFTRAGKPLSVCGELASDPAAAPVLVGLGLRKLSMSSACAPAVKEALAGKTLAQMEALADAVCNASTAGQAQALAQG